MEIKPMDMSQKQIKVDVKVNKDYSGKAKYTNAPLNTNFCQSFGTGFGSPKGTTKPEKSRG